MKDTIKAVFKLQYVLGYIITFALYAGVSILIIKYTPDIAYMSIQTFITVIVCAFIGVSIPTGFNIYDHMNDKDCTQYAEYVYDEYRHILNFIFEFSGMIAPVLYIYFGGKI